MIVYDIHRPIGWLLSSAMNIEFLNKSVLVTGAARGLGYALSESFAQRGAQVHATDILDIELEKLKGLVQCGRGGTVETYCADITDGAQVESLVAGIEDSHSGQSIDIVICAAGGIVGQEAKPIEQVSQHEWRAIVDANVTGVFNTVKAVLPSMKLAGTGAIVVISSGAGFRVSRTGIQSYAASKAGQIGLVRQLAHEVGPFGIRINSVAPGFMPTSPDYIRQWEGYGSEGQIALKESIALRRLGTPEEVAHAVMFLASEYAAFITGQIIAVNGTPS